jgi:hypothetical protein
VNITGGTDDEEQLNSLPDIFIANYPNDPDFKTCITGTSADNVVVNFPNPGKYGRVLEPPVEPATKPADYCTQIPPPSKIPTFLPDPPVHQDGGNNTAETATAAWSVGPVISAETQPADATIPRILSTTPPTRTLATTTMVVESTSIDLATLHPETAASTATVAGGGGKEGRVPCRAEDNGKLVCIGNGGDKFGLCDKGWAVVQAVAAGTKCRDGKIV